MHFTPPGWVGGLQHDKSFSTLNTIVRLLTIEYHTLLVLRVGPIRDFVYTYKIH